MDSLINWAMLLDAVIFSVFGILIFTISIFLLEKVTPFSIRKQIVEEKNVAMAIIIGAMAVGLSIIIGMAHG